jgi:hypothetical protein
MSNNLTPEEKLRRNCISCVGCSKPDECPRLPFMHIQDNCSGACALYPVGRECDEECVKAGRAKGCKGNYISCDCENCEDTRKWEHESEMAAERAVERYFEERGASHTDDEAERRYYNRGF